MSNRLADQPAVLEWVSMELRAAGHHQPLLPTPGRMSFETVTAAVAYATTVLPEAFRDNATISTGEVTLYWLDIAAMNKACTDAG
jgi:hypothetical protein